MIETDRQRRWWFATHPEYSRGHTGGGHRGSGEYDDLDDVEESDTFTPEDVDAYVDERLEHETDKTAIALLESAKFWLGTEFASKSPAERHDLLWGDDELEDEGGFDWETQGYTRLAAADSESDDMTSDAPSKTWKDYLADFMDAVKESLDPSRTRELIFGALQPVGRGYYLKSETLKKAEVIARGREIREVRELVRKYGGQPKNWIKWKGEGDGITPGRSVRRAEIHWYEHHGIGKREVKYKQWLD